MLRDFFTSLGDISQYGIISTLVFFIFFIIFIIRTVKMKNNEADSYGRMPLDDSSPESDQNQE